MSGRRMDYFLVVGPPWFDSAAVAEETSFHGHERTRIVLPSSVFNTMAV